MIENSNLKLEQSEGLKCGYGLNWYAYANNNPLKFVDPTGLTTNVYEDFMTYEDSDMGTEESGYAELANLTGFAEEVGIEIYHVDDPALQEKYGDILDVDTSDKFVAPVENGTISSWYGPRAPMVADNGVVTGSDHYGVDIVVDKIVGDKTVRSVSDGVVTKSDPRGILFGNNTKINTGEYTTLSAHLGNEHLLPEGTVVHANAPIGLMGETGAATGPHLHFAIFKNEPGKDYSDGIHHGYESINPSFIFSGLNQEPLY